MVGGLWCIMPHFQQYFNKFFLIEMKFFWFYPSVIYAFQSAYYLISGGFWLMVYGV